MLVLWQCAYNALVKSFVFRISDLLLLHAQRGFNKNRDNIELSWWQQCVHIVYRLIASSVVTSLWLAGGHVAKLSNQSKILAILILTHWGRVTNIYVNVLPGNWQQFNIPMIMGGGGGGSSYKIVKFNPKYTQYWSNSLSVGARYAVSFANHEYDFCCTIAVIDIMSRFVWHLRWHEVMRKCWTIATPFILHTR